MKRRRCFYCDAALVPSVRLASPAQTMATVDHVWPRAMLRQFVGPLPEWWRRLNRVSCCFDCNGSKANLAPTIWLQRLDHKPGWDRLHSRRNRRQLDASH